MPLTLACPSCSSRITAPDRLAGKTVRCPKCQTQFQIPPAPAVVSDFEVVEDDEPVIAVPRKPGPAADAGFEVVEDDEPVVAPVAKKSKPRIPVVEDDEPVVARRQSKSRPRNFDGDEDEDRDFDLRPKKRKRPTESSRPKWLIPTLGGLALLLAISGGVYFLVFDKKGGSGGGGSSNGIRWTTFDAPDGSFTASFPNGPPEGGDAMALINASGAAKTNPEQVAQAKKAMEQMGMSVNGWIREDAGRKYVVGFITIPAQLAALVKPDQLMNQTFTGQAQGGGQILSQKDVTVSGEKAKELFAKTPEGRLTLLQMFFLGNKVFVIGVDADASFTADDAIARDFFDKFVLKKK